jgi:hypothetical protein
MIMNRPKQFRFSLVVTLVTICVFLAPVSRPIYAQEELEYGKEKSLVIPRQHPRVWWTTQRLTRAKKWFLRNHFAPKANDPWGNGLCYVLTGQNGYARAAIKSLIEFSIPEDRLLKGVATDPYRVNDWFPVVYDWTYDAMTMEERQSLMNKYNHYVEVIMKKPWGGPAMPTSNYFWGHFRNELLWAIATYHENPKAKDFLDFALLNRWQQSFLPYAAKNGKGGALAEGAGYGSTMLAYPILPLVTAKYVGRDLYNETNWFKEAVFNVIYTTTPEATHAKASKVPDYFQIMSSGDIEHYGGYFGFHLRTYYGDFMLTAANEWRNQPVGQYARRWVNLVRPKISPYVACVDESNGERDFGDLPLDYYVPGMKYFYVRNQWGPNATLAFFQFGKGDAHSHQDEGSFQLWRKGRWLSKESSGYSTKFKGGVSQDTLAHNGILLGGLGIPRALNRGLPKTLRLESAKYYAYAVVDLSDMYRASQNGRPVPYDNPNAAHVVREMVFIRPLETLLILDRLEATSANVLKTFIVHSPERPQIEGPSQVVATNGDQALQITTLLPKTPHYEVVDESDFQGKHDEAAYYQYRLEVTDRGAKQSYFLHVLQCRDARQEGAKIQLEESASSWTIRLDQPALGHAVVVFNKGLRSTGGAVGYSAEGMPSNLTPLRKGVQDIEVTDKGPIWKN